MGSSQNFWRSIHFSSCTVSIVATSRVKASPFKMFTVNSWAMAAAMDAPQTTEQFVQIIGKSIFNIGYVYPFSIEARVVYRSVRSVTTRWIAPLLSVIRRWPSSLAGCDRGITVNVNLSLHAFTCYMMIGKRNPLHGSFYHSLFGLWLPGRVSGICWAPKTNTVHQKMACFGIQAARRIAVKMGRPMRPRRSKKYPPWN